MKHMALITIQVEITDKQMQDEAEGETTVEGFLSDEAISMAANVSAGRARVVGVAIDKPSVWFKSQ
jgi:hypothetical protein